MAITVGTDGSGPGVLLTRRAAALGVHPGQYALPGGRTGSGESVPDAARRELAEQLGMQLPAKSVLGLLDDYEARSGFVITPVVIWAGEHAVHHGQGCPVPFTDLDVEPVFVATPGSDRPVIRLSVHGEWLHAPTAAVLYQFREVVMYRRRTRVAHLAEPVFACPDSVRVCGWRRGT